MVTAFAFEPPLSELERSIKTYRPRATLSERVAQRRSRMRPFVDHARAKYPDTSPSWIATILRRDNEFNLLFRESRRTIEADVGAIMNPAETGDDEFEDEEFEDEE